MKLILFNTILVSFATTICGQKFQQESFPFPPQFQTPSTSFNLDNSIYLPLESQTPIPYFTMNNVNKFPFKFLPHNGAKTPSIFPTPLPLYLSSTLRFEDEENENDRAEIINHPTPASNRTRQSPINHGNNSTGKPVLDKREINFNTKITNHQPQPQKFDVKPQSYATVRPNDVVQIRSQNPASRRMIITSEIQRSDQGPDQIKATSFHNPQYIQSPGVFISSTTEPAIPILRLSNEMDLDGSFSYEALGADQTHYVQHSRMENMGTDKEEQVVEGSYSYVGDDGRTYTVHYVADSNGFRATGDHLPVSPPIPEIIQRSIQYNLAEEAKKPPHLKSSWENDDKDYEINERGIYNIPPQRNLFTGKNPEAFSFGFSQGSNSQNNLVTAASFQVPAKSSYEIAMDQSKAKVNSMPISPQITFLASQGAHNPSTPSQPPTKVVSSEKSALPQLMNYEAQMKESDQEANKALWRWQYGLTSNTHQNPKNSISRSFSEGDDVIINFNDMTPDQYTQMIQTHILSENNEASFNIENNARDSYQLNHSSQNINNTLPVPEQFYASTETVNLYTQQSDEIKKTYNINDDFQEHIQDDQSVNKNKKSGIYPDIISRHNFIPQSQIATQSYTFENTSFEPSKITIPNGNSVVNLNTAYKISHNDILSSNYHQEITTSEPTFNTVQTTESMIFYANNENNNFVPIGYNANEIKEDTTTMETSTEDIIRKNIFLRNLLGSRGAENITTKPLSENNKITNHVTQSQKELNHNKEPKYFQLQENPQNEMKVTKSKPLDINNILNFIVMKNHFESIKTKQKNKPIHNFSQTTNVKEVPAHYITVKENSSYDVQSNESSSLKQNNDYKALNRQQQQELQGLIKNYKVLQRPKNTMQWSQSPSEPQKHIKAFHTHSLPPLGRAGPSMKSYLPPTYL